MMLWDAPTMGGDGRIKADCCGRVVRRKSMQYVKPLGWGTDYLCDSCKEAAIINNSMTHVEYMAVMGCPQEILDKY